MLTTLLATALLVPSLQSSNGPGPDAPLVAASSRIEAPVRSVTLYPGRAAVTRRLDTTLPQGLHALTFPALPPTIDPASIQARASGSAVRIQSVDYRERPVSTAEDPAVVELDASITAVRRELERLDQERRLLDDQQALLESVALRVGADASERMGTPTLDLKALRAQIEFVGDERAALLERFRELDERRRTLDQRLVVLEAEREARASHGTTAREAVVTVAAIDGGTVELELVYLVADAGWQPIYNVRAAPPEPSVTIEYDAVLVQRSGEDWTDVELTLSTAQPTRAANPPALSPWYVRVTPPPARTATVAPAESAVAGDEDTARFAWAGDERFKDAMGRRLQQQSGAALVLGDGPAISYTLPRRVSVDTNADRQQRTRIATVEAPATFVHVAVPLLTEDVYLRGALTNASPFQLLPGPASVFLGADYIGPTTMPSVAPSAETELYFGIDRAVRASRQVVTSQSGTAGFFGSQATRDADYRLVLDNPTAAPIRMELWDRIPVSQDARIDVTLRGPSAPLATDPLYLEEDRPQGLLKWPLTVGANASGPRALVVTFGVRIAYPKDLPVSGLPD